MASASAPTILLIPGAFTKPSCYDLVIPYLERAGFPTVVASLASSNPDKPDEHTAATDGSFLLENYLIPLVKDGKEVVVFAHSFGATSLSGAGRSLSKRQRSEAGLDGGVLGLIYISFAMCTDGQSQLAYLGGSWPPFCKLNYPSQGLLVFDPVVDMLFNDAVAEQQDQLAKTHLPHSINVFETPVSSPLWVDSEFDNRRVLIKTMQDATFPPSAQQMFAEKSGVQWKIVEIDAGHEAILTKPEAISRLVVDSTELFGSTSSH